MRYLIDDFKSQKCSTVYRRRVEDNLLHTTFTQCCEYIIPLSYKLAVIFVPEPSNVHANSYPHRGTRGETVDGNPLVRVFYMLRYFETIFPSVESLWSSLQDEVYFRGSGDGAVVRALAFHQCGPGSIPGLDVICGLSLLLVLFSAPRGFSLGTPECSSV